MEDITFMITCILFALALAVVLTVDASVEHCKYMIDERRREHEK